MGRGLIQITGRANYRATAADARDFVGLTRRINGGTNGLADRQALYAVATSALNSPVAAGAPAG